MKKLNLLKRKKKLCGNIYCVQSGERAGEFLLFLDYDEDRKVHSVLTLPECDPIFVSNIEYDRYMESDLLDFVETLPKDIVDECKLEFNLRKSQIKQ